MDRKYKEPKPQRSIVFIGDNFIINTYMKISKDILILDHQSAIMLTS